MLEIPFKNYKMAVVQSGMFLVPFCTCVEHEAVSSIGLYEYVRYIYYELVQFQNLSYIFTIVFQLKPLPSLQKHRKQCMTIHVHY
jgi:hypothetical protein